MQLKEAWTTGKGHRCIHRAAGNGPTNWGLSHGEEQGRVGKD